MQRSGTISGVGSHFLAGWDRTSLAASDLYVMHQGSLPAGFQAIYFSFPTHWRDPKTVDAGYDIQFLRWVPRTEFKIRLACFWHPHLTFSRLPGPPWHRKTFSACVPVRKGEMRKQKPTQKTSLKLLTGFTHEDTSDFPNDALMVGGGWEIPRDWSLIPVSAMSTGTVREMIKSLTRSRGVKWTKATH